MGGLIRLACRKDTLVFVFKSLFSIVSSKLKGLFSKQKSTEEVVEIEEKEEKAA